MSNILKITVLAPCCIGLMLTSGCDTEYAAGDAYVGTPYYSTYYTGYNYPLYYNNVVYGNRYYQYSHVVNLASAEEGVARNPNQPSVAAAGGGFVNKGAFFHRGFTGHTMRPHYMPMHNMGGGMHMHR